MIFKSPVYSQASGSIGGITYSRNRGGMYTRARAIPTNPGTSQQTEVRAALASLTQRWIEVLTPAQRQYWEDYAANVTVPNALGEQIHLTGLQHYIRSGVPRLQVGVALADDGPSVYNLGNFTPIGTVTADASAQEVSIPFTNTDDWAIEPTARLIAYVSRPVNPTVNFWNGPYRFAEALAGSTPVPPASPFVVTPPYEIFEALSIHGYVRVSYADSRLTVVQKFGPILVGA